MESSERSDVKMIARFTGNIRGLALALFVGAVSVGAVGCEAGKDACPEVDVAPGCELRCARTVTEGDTMKVCGKFLILTGQGSNDILQTKTRKIQTRTLPKEACVTVKDGKLAVPAEAEPFQKFCAAPKDAATSQPR